MIPTSAPSIWWIRRDLRLADNPALVEASETGGQVIPVFVLDPVLLNSPYNSPRRTAFLFDGLRALDRSLRERGSRLIVRSGDPAQALAQLVAETGATRITAERRLHALTRGARDERLGRSLPLTLVDGVSVHPPGEIVRKRRRTVHRLHAVQPRLEGTPAARPAGPDACAGVVSPPR